MCFSLTGIVWLWEVEPHPVMALFWELSLLRGDPQGLQLLHVPLQLGMAHCGEQHGRAQSPGDEGVVRARTTTGTGFPLTL